MKNIFYILILSLLFSACSEYQKVLKSSNLQYKYEKAIEYYEAKEHIKAYPLFEELIALYRGTERAENLYYYYAYCDFKLGDYLLAGYRFKNFTRTYPNSKYVEECKFMSAYCYYLDSPKWSLDQTNTYKAIEEMQIFVNRYPSSTRVDTCNTLLDELNFKLEKKAFELSKLYVKTEDYKSSITSLINNLEDYPGGTYKEEIIYLLIKSHYDLAKNSIVTKKRERYEDTIKAYTKFAPAISDKSFRKEVDAIVENAKKDLKGLNT